jgi:chromosome segregation ATPase
MLGQVARGGTEEEARQNFIQLYREPDTTALAGQQMDPIYGEIIKEKDRVEDELNAFDETETLLTVLRERDEATAEINSAAKQRRKAAKEIREQENKAVEKEARNRQIDEIKRKIKAGDGQLGQITKRINELRGQLSDVDELKGQVAETRKQYDETREAIARKREKGEDTSELVKEANGFKGKLGSLNRKLKQKQQERSIEIEALTDLEDQRSALREEIASLKQQVEGVQKTPQKTIDAARQAAEKQRENLREADESLRSRVSEERLEEARQAAEDERNRLRTQRDRLRQAQRELQGENAQRNMERIIRQSQGFPDLSDPRVDAEPFSEIAEDAARAPEPGQNQSSEAARAEQEIQEVLQEADTRLTEEDQAFVEDALEEAQTREQRASLMERIKDCMGSRNG